MTNRTPSNTWAWWCTSPALPALLLLVGSLLACSSAATHADTGSDTGPPDAPTTDADVDIDEVGADEDDLPPAGPPPVAPYEEPGPFPIYAWRVAEIDDPRAGDPIMDALESGTFEMPEVGVDAEGVEWSSAELDENGVFGTTDGARLYAAAEFYTAEPTGVIARADTVQRVYTNGVPQPGDVYGSRRLRLPIRTQAGNNLIVVQALGRRDPPQLEFVSTTDELVFNLLDLTVPDLRVGDDSVQFVGVPILNLSGLPAEDVTARVVANELFEETVLSYPSLGAGAVTQVAFELRPRAPFAEAELTVPVRLRLESNSLQWSYEREIELTTVASEATFRRTFRSTMDGSAQYYAVVPPADFDPGRAYGLVLSLHGASVWAINQARSYSRKDWTYVVAATNRRPFGFDWEAWGRLDGLEVLDHAMGSYRIDPERVHVTGHSMGGHGTWQFGVLFPGRFAVIGPSAGWSSYYSYIGYARPTGPFARSQASSDTNQYLGNLAQRGVYIIHGDADDNVPVRESRDMFALVKEITDDVVYHEQPGAGHWWDGDVAPGVDCVDWTPLFEFMGERRLDPWELDFDFVTPSPSVSATHSYVTIRSALDPYEDCELTSLHEGDAVTLTTNNVRSMVLAGHALIETGVRRLVVDGAEVQIADGPIALGPQDGKREDAYGPFNQVLERPFCLVYPDDGPEVYRDYAAFLLTNWAFAGNGHGCALPLSSVTEDLRRDHNIVYVGVAREAVPAVDLAFDWNDDEVLLDGNPYEEAAAAFVFPEGERLGAAMFATRGSEYLLFRLQPFSSGFALPDYLIWTNVGGQAAGFFDATWRFDPDLGVGQ